ncbi:hypothetical protein FB451DRAFT_1166617 [Mycena latifolia]|nr:hypothetical protein FB451DRAFT_1166617 [Mycena latifolia]
MTIPSVWSKPGQSSPHAFAQQCFTTAFISFSSGIDGWWPLRQRRRQFRCHQIGVGRRRGHMDGSKMPVLTVGVLVGCRQKEEEEEEEECITAEVPIRNKQALYLHCCGNLATSGDSS